MDYIIIGTYVVGVILAWNRISNGIGFPVNKMSPITLRKINSLTPGGIFTKVLLSLVLGYLVFALIVIACIIKIFSIIAGL